MRFLISFFILGLVFLTMNFLTAKGTGVQVVENQQADKSLDKKTAVILETTQGRIDILLWPDVAPKACENFESLVNKGYYNDVPFHRIVKGFMIQGGDPTGTGRGGQSIWGRPFADEFNSEITFNSAGLVAMANAGPNTNGSQFFITTAATPWLNGKHTIFGKVIRGMSVVKKLDKVPVDAQDRPVKEQKILKAYITKRYAKQEER